MSDKNEKNLILSIIFLVILLMDVALIFSTLFTGSKLILGLGAVILLVIHLLNKKYNAY